MIRKAADPSAPSPPVSAAAARWSLALRVWRTISAIDARSLGVFRIALGLLLFLDVAMRLPDAQTFFSDQGVVPRSVCFALQSEEVDTGRRFWLSPLLMTGETSVIRGFLLCMACAALFLMLGWRTRTAAIVCYVCLCAVQARSPSSGDGGDQLIRVALFWGLFLPLDARFSLDRWRRAEPPRDAEPHTITGIAAFALLTQIAYVYFFGALGKNSPEWREDYNALYYALSLDMFATSLGKQLLTHLELTRFLTCATWWLEFLGPCLLFVPWGTRWFRLAMVLCFWGFHIGTALTLHLSLFPWIGCAVWLVVLPAAVWDGWPGKGLAAWLRRLGARGSERWESLRQWLNCVRPPPALLPRRHSWPQTAVVSALWVYVLLWNLREAQISLAGWSLPRSANVAARLLRIDQEWLLFAPSPTVEDGWFVMKGVLRNGDEVNLWRPGEPLPWDKPHDFCTIYPGRRWRKHLNALWLRQYRPLRGPFVHWLARRWNADHAAEQVERVTLYYQLETTVPPGQSQPPPVTIKLWEESIRNDPLSPAST